jgi:hypothetical protein
MRNGNRVLVSIAAALAMLAACSPPGFPRELFTIEAAAIPRPVMVSQPPHPIGRTVRALEGVTATQQSLVLTGTSRTETRIRDGASASEVFNAQILRGDRWIQIDRAEFRALDYNGYGAALTERMLIITGTAYR